MTLKEILIAGKITVSEGGGGGGGGSDLPAEYQRVEYIDGSAAGAVINTGIHPKESLAAVVKFMPLEQTGDVLFGTKGGGDSADWRVFNASGGAYFDCGNGNGGRINIGAKLPSNTLANVAFLNHSLYDLTTGKNWISKQSPVSFSELNYDIYLNGGSTTMTSKSKWYSFTLYDCGVAVRDFIPCYRKSDNVVGMYDTVTKGFFTSVGSGQFTAGPNVEGE